MGYKYALSAVPYPFNVNHNGISDQYDVSWKSSDETIALVIDGMVVPQKTGTVTITATLRGTEMSDSCTIKIVDENAKLASTFYSKLKSKGIDPELYIWDKNSCCFPGVRRYAGSSEIAAHRKRMEISSVEDAIALDDNDYPKQIWSFIFRDKQFSKYGPSGYSLAHLIDHKKEKNRMKDEFIFLDNHVFEKTFYGLYTCASNSVYVPNNVMKPTDFNESIRNLLIRKAESLYGNYCNLVPSYIKVKEPVDSKWNIENFEWSTPVGTTDNLDDFFTFRNKKLDEIFNK
jgi:hypothetical protein